MSGNKTKDEKNSFIDKVKSSLQVDDLAKLVTLLVKKSIDGLNYTNLQQNEISQEGLKIIENALIDQGRIPTASDDVPLKIIKDPIYGHVALHPLCRAIVDTKQFQRLRYIQQLGLVSYVYPGACHTRFEHSLGISQLAGQFVRTLAQNRPFLSITQNDILCVEIAGLCLNLGHGPFSDVFRIHFTERNNDNKNVYTKSAEMFDHLIVSNTDVKSMMEQYKILDPEKQFIKSLITGAKITDNRKYTFLRQIVYNQNTMVDVATWDRCARDCHHLGIKESFDFSRIIMFAKVAHVDNELKLCLRDKEISNLTSMFRTHYTLYRYVYNHKVKDGADTMLVRLLHKVLEKTELETLEQFEMLTDLSVISQIKGNKVNSFESDLLEDILNRRFLVPAFEEFFDDVHLLRGITAKDLMDVIMKAIDELPRQKSMEFGNPVIPEQEVFRLEPKGPHFREIYWEKNVIIKKTILDFDMKNLKDLTNLTTYSKAQPKRGKYIEWPEAKMLLGQMSERVGILRIYYTRHKDPALPKEDHPLCGEISAATQKYLANLRAVSPRQQVTLTEQQVDQQATRKRKKKNKKKRKKKQKTQIVE